MKNKNKMLYCVAIIVLTVGFSALYYYLPRNIFFELVKEINKPYLEFDRTYYIGFDYVENTEQLMFYMVDYYKKASCVKANLNGYDSIFVKNLGKELDFKKYDYIITYQKQLKELRHSPYLTKTEDGLYYLKETPLIPTWDSLITDKIYIYRIKKNSKYRAPGP
jgi:hypothetical protein